MPSIQTGKAVIFGFKGTVSGAGVGGAASFLNESGDISNDVKIDEIRNEDNELVGLIHSGQVFDASLTFTPAAGSISGVNALMTAPTLGGKVTLSGFQAAAMNQTDWVYVGGWKMAFKKDGIATYELKIKRGANFDISAVIS
jgi:hypothetical protein